MSGAASCELRAAASGGAAGCGEGTKWRQLETQRLGGCGSSNGDDAGCWMLEMTLDSGLEVLEPNKAVQAWLGAAICGTQPSVTTQRATAGAAN